jgi:hypothetical protein
VSQDIYDILANHEVASQTQDGGCLYRVLTVDKIMTATRSFSREDVTSILNNAFAFIMESIPILHRPTFGFDLVPRCLCISIFFIGLFMSNEPALNELGCILLEQTRSELLQVRVVSFLLR